MRHPIKAENGGRQIVRRFVRFLSDAAFTLDAESSAVVPTFWFGRRASAPGSSSSHQALERSGAPFVLVFGCPASDSRMVFGGGPASGVVRRGRILGRARVRLVTGHAIGVPFKRCEDLTWWAVENLGFESSRASRRPIGNGELLRSSQANPLDEAAPTNELGRLWKT